LALLRYVKKAPINSSFPEDERATTVPFHKQGLKKRKVREIGVE
jgi:hypothetical protein